MSRSNGKHPRPLRVCVTTSLQGVQEPRAPRHAAWIAALGPEFEVVFVDSAPFDTQRRPVRALEGFPNLQWRTNYFSVRAAGVGRLIFDRLRQRLSAVLFQIAGIVSAGALSTRVFGLERMLVATEADVYLGHNAETLWPVFRAAQRRRALVMFDSMEFHSDMGEGQTSVARALTRQIEARALPGCALITASSAQVADALAAEYAIPRPLPLDNVPVIEKEIPAKPAEGLAIYWRNSVVGLGHRGLDEALVALTRLPPDVTLHLQGRLPDDGGAAMKTRIAELGLASRVVFHPPYAPEDAVQEAARHHVGLCLERKGCRNHDLTTSNKIFDYHMGGLAVIASDLPGLRGVIERSRGGLLFRPGSAPELAEKIATLYRDRSLLHELAGQAREFGLREANREVEGRKFCAAFAEVCRTRLGRSL